MLRELSKNWWMLALCGIADAMCAAMNLLMLSPDGSLSLHRFALPGGVRDMGMLALIAGACAMAAGLWNSGRGSSWLLALHGLALGVFGGISVSPLVRGPLSFRPISLLFLLMSASLGAFALGTARTLRGASDRWFPGACGAASAVFAVSFIAVGFGWVRLPSPQSYWIWMSAYFGLCAIFMLWLALRLRRQSVPGSRPSEFLPATGRPRPAH